MKLKELPGKIIGHVIILGMVLMLAGGGFAILWSAAASIFSGSFDFGEFIMMLVAGTLFGGAGLGVIYAVYLREAVDDWIRRFRQDRYGDRPWMLKRDWRKGRIVYRAMNPAAFLWVFALGWNGMLGLVLYANRLQILEAVRGNWLNALGIGVFVLIGLGVLFAAVRLTFTRRIAGWGVFTMDSVPGEIGGKLRGSIRTRIPAGFDKPVKLELSSAAVTALERQVPREQMTETPRGLVVPVDLDIPGTLKGTNLWDPEHKVVWTLTAQAQVEREAWEATFVVPLFKLHGQDT